MIKEVRCHPDACTDVTICQTHLSPSSPATTSLIQTSLWPDGWTWCVYVSRLSQHQSDCVICRVRQGTECFQRVLSLDNCAYVVGTTQHTYASGQRWLPFPCSFVLTLPVRHSEKSLSFPPLSFPLSSFLFPFLSPLSFSFLFLLCPVLFFISSSSFLFFS